MPQADHAIGNPEYGMDFMSNMLVETSEVVRTFTAAWRHMSSQYVGNLQSQDGVVCVSLSNTICPFFNMLTIDQPITETDGLRLAIATARHYADDCPNDAMLLM